VTVCEGSASPERHSLRYRLRDLTTLKRVKDCGHVSINGAGSGPSLRLTTVNFYLVPSILR
jgi:hypothetical protein